MTEKPDPLSVFGKPADEDRRIDAYQDTQIVGRTEKPPIATRLREIAAKFDINEGWSPEIAGLRTLASEIEAIVEEMRRIAEGRADRLLVSLRAKDLRALADALAARKEPVE